MVKKEEEFNTNLVKKYQIYYNKEYYERCKINMNKQELEEVLLLNKVPKDLYSLSGGLPNESYCLEKEKNRWHVYYSERGIKTSVGYFENEEAACECLLKEIRKIVSIV